jgi:drug/metabolite transporter (DMT)-like permease
MNIVAASKTHLPAAQHDVARGLLLVLVAMAVLPGQDTVAKYLAADLSPLVITWVRFLLQSVFTLPFLLYFQGRAGLMPARLWPNVIRGALIAASATMFFVAIKFMPIADALAVFFIEPFILTILSAVLDGEEVGWRRRLAVTVGFVGVLIVVQPSWSVFGPVSILPAVSGSLFSVYAILNRRMSVHDTPLTMQFVAGLSAFGVQTLLVAAAWLFGWAAAPASFGWESGALLLLMGVLGTSGHLVFVHASRLVPSSLIAPMQYVEIIAATALGYAVFGDFPSPLKWLGIVIVVGSGVYVFWRESRAGTHPPETTASPG